MKVTKQVAAPALIRLLGEERIGFGAGDELVVAGVKLVAGDDAGAATTGADWPSGVDMSRHPPDFGALGASCGCGVVGLDDWFNGVDISRQEAMAQVFLCGCPSGPMKTLPDERLPIAAVASASFILLKSGMSRFGPPIKSWLGRTYLA